VPDPTRSERETTSERPLVTVIIPHYLGDVVSRCLDSIARVPCATSFEIIIVDDQPRDDGSIGRAVAAFPGTRVTKTHGSHGFGAACNAGIRAARGQYLAILNNDVEVAPGWLDALVSAADSDETIGLLQAKIRSLHNREQFDYSGAAGGLIDWLGFPFAIGRVFGEIEKDCGQHDMAREIFWAVGSALLIRRSCLDRAGLFDEAFYMHMEEIDLAWRVQLAGFRVVSCPSAIVYHWNGFSLRQDSFKKAYLNHRNSLVLLLKNLPARRLATILPLRVGLDFATLLYGLLRRDWKQPVAAVVAILWVLVRLPTVFQRRQEARTRRRVSDEVVLARMRPRSVVVDHFVRRFPASKIAAATTPAGSTLRWRREALAGTTSVKPRLGLSLASH
jgi:GT2 family glycosyltransferase